MTITLPYKKIWEVKCLHKLLDQAAGTEWQPVKRMLKVLILALATLSVDDIIKAENICNSAINAVPVILPGPAGPPGPPGEKGNSGSQPGGAVYTRWGRTMCPTGATLVYTGRAAGADYYQLEGLVTPSACRQHLSTSPLIQQLHMYPPYME